MKIKDWKMKLVNALLEYHQAKLKRKLEEIRFKAKK